MKKEIISYLFFGVLTTLVNFLAYMLLTDVFKIHYTWATSLSWFFAVLFAFITNKIYVFKTKGNFKNLVRELGSFLTLRLLSLGIDLGLMILLVSVLHINDLVSKIAANVIIVIVNYVFSKYIIFTNKKPSFSEGSRD
jgi:putative flippase GtrA